MRFAIAGIIFIAIAALLFSVFIFYNYFFYEDETGIANILDEQAQKTMNNQFYQSFKDNDENFRFAFGLLGVLCLFIATLLFVLDALTKPILNE
jgi:choline-glycine betaine transporter